jgi:cytosine/adenosine deaminase-related metal-dependent hydrolase
VGVSVDNLVLAGSADFLGLLGMLRDLEKGRTHDEFRMSARRALELGTIEGARSMGMDNLVGSLKPGKRADLILVSTRHINLGVFTDPAQMLVEAAQPENIDTVVADGRILKRGGAFTAFSQDQILDAAAASLAGLRQRAAAA